ncbi:hypothetical protein ABN028_19450 [Actinopolymorpha sp. B17G11]|uniref:hypothetical protein n=1 Tax=Actinopolymorpha sp. B17G11 TaxID=3160861 RepID=UPI0032E4B110
MTRVVSDSGSGNAVYEITVARVPLFDEMETPSADDLPEDVRVALHEWLGPA